MLLRADSVYVDGHKYGLHACDFCGQEYRTRIRRERKADNCGCRANNYRHGHEIGRRCTPELKAYRKLMERCYSVRCKDYGNYGGRGITVCVRWRKSFQNFYADMGPRPKDNSIDRIDVNKGYSPGNCRWATKTQQARNTRTNVYLTIGGETRCVTEWAGIYGIVRSTYYRRIKRGMTPLQALGVGRAP
jgi:hypothetical protein